MDAKEASIYTAVLIVSIVLGTIIVYFIISIIRQQRKNLELYRLNILAEISTLEKERTRIAADLHDELGPLLSAVKLRINSFELTDEEDKIQVEKTNEHLDNLIRRMREISYDLMPNTLKRKGLVVALNEFIDYIARGNRLKIKLSAPDGLLVEEQKSIHLYRIAQEVIHNTIKHAKANELVIKLYQEKDYVVMTTSDDGTGFDYQEHMKEKGGLGLRNLLSRTEIMGGKMFLESEKGKGTTYTFEIPVKYEYVNHSHQSSTGR